MFIFPQSGASTMNAGKGLDRSSYLSRNLGDFPAEFVVDGTRYLKVEDLRYGTNPHQPAAWYRPADRPCPIGEMVILKSGKSGLSQTNLEDVSYALNIVKFFEAPACAVMKHVNPSGAAVRRGTETLREVYIKARDCDARAAFGSVVAFNVGVDAATALEIMSTFVECVVAPDFANDALAIFNDQANHKLNKHIRVLRCGDLGLLPGFVGDDEPVHRTLKVLADGSLVVAAPLLTSLRSVEELGPAVAEDAKAGERVIATIRPTPEQAEDLLAAWYINLNVRSNGVVIMKNGQTLSVGTGEQDRVGAIEQAIAKYRQKYQGPNTLDGAAMASDGFFPFADGIEVAASAGIRAVIAPAGSLRDAEVIRRANELGVALIHAPERIFSHH